MEELKVLGLSDHEIRIYVALLKMGMSTAPQISKETGVERAVTYHTLEKLARKGLVSSVLKNKRKYFTATGPEKLLEMMKEKEEIVKDVVKKLKGIKKPKETLLPEIEIYSGKEGLKNVLNDVLEEGRNYFIMGYTGAASLIGYWFARWQRKRVKLGIKRKVLFPRSLKRSKLTKYPLTERRFLPEGFETPSSTIIYGTDKVLIFIPGKEFVGIIIKSKGLWKSYKTFFDALWKVSK